ncbi:hypothetical protein L2750_15595 [Shewanella submarina]|uniref:Right handed beta helix domain-containing protein n=1 Tax=Shewanella submarina TaxID=2016376 RepID=A0ABV7GA12_9GAMM|nr:hypothetical protein [Shewanella submarina]MCL1038558.1 hypothetical protein [Shewanella submarina]
MEILPDRRKKRLGRWEKITLILGLLVLVAALTPSPAWVKTFLIQKGFMAMSNNSGDKVRQLVSDGFKAPVNMLRADSQLPLLQLDIKYQEWMKLSADRDQALADGVIPEQRQTVKANLQYLNKSYKAKVRLQGDMLDHIKGPNRWSFRVQLDKKQAIFTSRKFAIVSPDVRIHQGPTLFSETMKYAGFDVIAPFHKPVRVIVNGSDWGVMLFEQAFSQELLAVNNRTEGLITRLELDGEYQDDEGLLVRKLRPRVLQQGTIMGNPALRRQRTLALGLISDFLAGTRPASDVFDTVRLGQYLATVDAWGAWHALTWNNWRWYFNPHTARLEPIQSDVAVVPAAHIWLMRPPSQSFHLSRQMLADSQVRASYLASLAKLKHDLISGKLTAHLQQTETILKRQLHTSAPLLGSFDLKVLQTQLTCLNTGFKKPECSEIQAMDPALHKHFDRTHAVIPWDRASQFTKTPEGYRLTVTNTLTKPLQIAELSGSTRFNEVAELDSDTVTFPTLLAPGESLNFAIPLKYPTVTLFAAEVGGNMAPYEWSDSLNQNFLPRGQAPANKLPDFIMPQQNAWQIRPGNWQIDDYLVSPPDWKLLIPAGTTLSFAPGAGLMIFGELHIAGTGNKPVQLNASNPKQGWQGLTLMGTEGISSSRIRHLNVSHAASPKQGNWRPRGAVYLVNSKLDIAHLSITDNSSEDALNIINSQVEIKQLQISNALSDAFDCDFCTGTIEGGSFSNIGKRSGGDGIDVSGSNLSIRDISFNTVRDKAISAGENSRLDVSHCRFDDVNFALVSKDASHIQADNIEIGSVTHYGLMSYSKKPFFGPATMAVETLECDGFSCLDKARVALESQLLLDGIPVPPKKLNVKELYRTVMKSDKPQ